MFRYICVVSAAMLYLIRATANPVQYTILGHIQQQLGGVLFGYQIDNLNNMFGQPRSRVKSKQLLTYWWSWFGCQTSTVLPTELCHDK